MNILINCSNLKMGGALQVADSICQQLNKYTGHNFTVVLSKPLEYLKDKLDNQKNIHIEYYTLSNKNAFTLLTGRDKFLDKIVEDNKIDVVFFVFGPSLWYPKVKVVSGFAMSHLLLNDSPYWQIISKKDWIKIKIRNLLQKKSFRKLADIYFTENKYISDKLSELFPEKKIVTITNTCHQIFHQPELWDRTINLPHYDGYTLITISADYPHKNLNIIPKVLDELRKMNPTFKVRFVLTVDENHFGELEEWHKERIIFLGKVKIDQCPWLYSQSDALFLPTLLECFSASYAEAMSTSTPILTSDLGFAKSLCEDSAVYFNPLDPKAIAENIIQTLTTPELIKKLVENGIEQIKKFDASSTRIEKIMSLIEE